MRIAHIKNPANVVWVVGQAQRRLDHEAVVFSFEQNEFAFPWDVRIMAGDGVTGIGQTGAAP